MAIEAKTVMRGPAAEITLSGELDHASVDRFKEELTTASAHKPKELRLLVSELKWCCSRGLQALLHAKQTSMPGVVIRFIDPTPTVVQTLEWAGLIHEIIIR